MEVLLDIEIAHYGTDRHAQKQCLHNGHITNAGTRSFVNSSATAYAHQTVCVHLSQPRPTEKESSDYIWILITRTCLRVTSFRQNRALGHAPDQIDHAVQYYQRRPARIFRGTAVCLSQVRHSTVLPRIHFFSRQIMSSSSPKLTLKNCLVPVFQTSHIIHSTVVKLLMSLTCTTIISLLSRSIHQTPPQHLLPTFRTTASASNLRNILLPTATQHTRTQSSSSERIRQTHTNKPLLPNLYLSGHAPTTPTIIMHSYLKAMDVDDP